MGFSNSYLNQIKLNKVIRVALHGFRFSFLYFLFTFSRINSYILFNLVTLDRRTFLEQSLFLPFLLQSLAQVKADNVYEKESKN